MKALLVSTPMMGHLNPVLGRRTNPDVRRSRRGGHVVDLSARTVSKRSAARFRSFLPESGFSTIRVFLRAA